MASAYEESLLALIGSMLGGMDFSDPNSIYYNDPTGNRDPILAKRAGSYFNSNVYYGDKAYLADSYVDETDPFAVEASKGFVVTSPIKNSSGGILFQTGQYIRPGDPYYDTAANGGYGSSVAPISTSLSVGDTIGYGPSRSLNQNYTTLQSYLDTLKQREAEQQANDPLSNVVGQMNAEYDKGEGHIGSFLSTLGSLPQQYQSRENDIMSMLDGQGAQQHADIGSQFNQQRAATDQGLSSRGLGNTTVRSSAMQGLASAESAEKRRLGETLTNQKVGAKTQLSGDYLSSLGNLASGYQSAASRYPSLIDIGNLALQYGKAAGDRTSIPVRSLLGT